MSENESETGVVAEKRARKPRTVVKASAPQAADSPASAPAPAVERAPAPQAERNEQPRQERPRNEQSRSEQSHAEQSHDDGQQGKRCRCGGPCQMRTR